MAYFLKTTHKNKGDYIQIYESFREPGFSSPRHKCFKTLGYVADLVSDEIPDPVAHYRGIVKSMNEERNLKKRQEKEQQISDVSPLKCLGYFPASAIMKRLDIQSDIELLQTDRRFEYNVFAVLEDMVYARLINPCSKHKTLETVIPSLWSHSSCSYDQLRSALEFLGERYEKIVEAFAFHTKETYDLDTSSVLFDCTNFYFEIDREDLWRRKGPSKENRKDPILGMGLLLDKNAVPVGMHLYPGNQSEIPEIRQIINKLKSQQNISGRTIQVADKGLNCAQNVIEALDHGDGYLFSKSIKKMDGKYRDKILTSEGFQDVFDAKGKLKYSVKSWIEPIEYEYTDKNGRTYKKTVDEKRVLTYNPKLAKKQRLELDKEVERARRCCFSQAKKREFGDSIKFASIKSKDGSKAVYEIDDEKVKEAGKCCGYNMLITSELDVEDTKIYDQYHQLWRIEETFKCLKSELDARPVYLRDIERIKGHFLVCYIAVLLERLFQFKVLDGKFESHQIYDFFREFKVVEINSHRIMNVSRTSSLIEYMANEYTLPLTNLYLKPSDIKKVLERAL